MTLDLRSRAKSFHFIRDNDSAWIRTKRNLILSFHVDGETNVQEEEVEEEENKNTKVLCPSDFNTRFLT